MSNGRQVGPDLMASPGYQLYLQQRQPASMAQGHILRTDRPGAFPLFPKNSHLVGLPVFCQISFQAAGLLQFSLHHAPVIFIHRPVMEQLPQLLQPGNGFAGGHYAAGVPVQPVAHGWAEVLQVFGGYRLAAEQVSDQIFHQRTILRPGFLGKHSRRLVYKQHMLVLVEYVQLPVRVLSVCLLYFLPGA